jgi:hypothetical protein
MAVRVVTAVETILVTGKVATYAATTAEGLSFANDGHVFLHVKNAGASPCNVTIQTPEQRGGLDVGEQVVAVTNGTEKFIGPFPTPQYNRPSGGSDAGYTYVDFSYLTSVTVAVLTA